MRITSRKAPGYTAGTASVPAPVGGWNARDPIAAMDAKDAIILRNWWPQYDGVSLRPGWNKHVGSTPLAGSPPPPVESLATYVNASGTETLFAWAGTSVYDATAASATWGAAVDIGVGDARWNAINFRTSAAAYLFCVRQAGGTAPRTWNGSAWATPTITGLTPANICGVYSFKRRLWFLQVNSTQVAFLPVDSIQGAAEVFDPGSLLKKGGYFVAGATWTIDAGEGLDDHLVLISSEGEAVVYAGTSPVNNDFRVIGVYDIGAPLGRRCFVKLAGDLIILTRDGALPLSGALQSTRVRPDVAVSDKIRGAFNQAALSYRTNFGWQAVFWPENQMLMLNVPVQAMGQEQYAMNTQTTAWAQFTNMHAYCWAQLNGELYFGSDGYVGQAWDGLSDNDFPIQADCQQAYNYFGARARVKRFTLVRPIFRVSPPFGASSIAVGINVDYEDVQPTNTPTYVGGASVSAWDTAGATWDSGLTWLGTTTQSQWLGVSGVGTAGALRMTLALANTELLWQTTDFVFETGGVL